MLRVATAVSVYPFYNFRYLKLLNEIAKRFVVYCFAASSLKDASVNVKTSASIFYILPFKLPRRISYHISPYLSQFWINLVEHDVVWLFDTASPLTPLFLRRPIVLDLEDPIIMLPIEELKKRSRSSLINEMRLLRSHKVVKIIVVTTLIKNKLIALGIEPERLEVIPYGVDTNLFKPTPLPDEPTVLYYGTFQEHRARLLINVVELVCKMDKNIKFFLIGDIPKWFRQNIKQQGLLDRVEMPGFINHDDLPQYLEKARVCLLPQDRSLGGRLSFKLLEYMASGRPVVATDVDESFPIKESGAGILTPIEPKAIAEAIIMLLNDKRLAKRMAERGILYAQRFDWNQMVEKYLKILQEAASVT